MECPEYKNAKLVYDEGQPSTRNAPALTDTVADLLEACKMLLDTCHEISWVHLNGDENCECKSCAIKFAKSVIEKAQDTLR